MQYPIRINKGHHSANLLHQDYVGVVCSDITESGNIREQPHNCHRRLIQILQNMIGAQSKVSKVTFLQLGSTVAQCLAL